MTPIDRHADHTSIWVILTVILAVLLCITWGAGSELSDLHRRVGQLEVQCSGQK